LITLVENASKHGIEPKPGTGRVEVRAREQEGCLWVQVLDNSAGLRPGTGSGMGLANVREQLANLFGDKASFRLHSLADGSTSAEIVVPQAC
jgi:sensor histidine kinase YesM